MADGTAVVRIDVLDRLTAHSPDGARSGSDLGSRKARQVLLLLAAAGHRPVSVDALVDALWGEQPPRQAGRVVASLISRLRATLGGTVIEGNADGWRLAGTVAVDLDEATDLVHQATIRLDHGELGLAVAAAQRALALLSSPPLDDVQTVVSTARQPLLRAARLVAAGALVAVGRPEQAVPTAAAAVAADALDEEAARRLMLAQQAAGDDAAALLTYAQLRRALREELGTDPSAESARLHDDVLQGNPPPQRGPLPRRRATRPRSALSADGLPFVGRSAEREELQHLWAEAVLGRGAFALIRGEPGVGKTRLAGQLVDHARQTGGLVLSARCFEAERSLLVQPVADALGVAGATLAPDLVRSAAAGHEAELRRLVPALAQVLPDGAEEEPGHPGAWLEADPAAAARQRTFEALSGFLMALSRAHPVLLSLDDLQHASTSTVEALHYLRRATGSSALLILATVRRVEGEATVAQLLPVVGAVLDLGPLEQEGVAELAAAAGHPARAEEIAQRTGGHALFVVEVLRDLTAGGTGRPASVQAAVLSRVAQCGPQVAEVLSAGAVLGNAFDPLLAAALCGGSTHAALAACQQALDARLLTAQGQHFEFANDLIREAIYGALDEPTRVAQHRLAADLMVDQPEAVARHALAAGQARRATLSWLLAAETALRRFAARDAEALADLALQAATALGDAELMGRSLLVRGHGRDARSAHDQAHQDFVEAGAAARDAGDVRLEMAALRASSGDVMVTVARTVTDIENPLLRMLDIARALGDGGAEADALSRLAILAGAQLDFVQSARRVAQAERVAAASGDPVATTHALDARKNLLAYQGLVAELGPVIRRLEPRHRGSGDLWSLQWTVFESAFAPLAAEDYDAAEALVEEALRINRRSGFVTSESWYVAHLGWVHRLRGDLGSARQLGARAVQLSREHGRHRWWLSSAAGLYAGSLLADGATSTAYDLLAPLRPNGSPVGDEGYRLRLLAPLAEAGGRIEDLQAADALHAGIRSDAGRAWLLGADTYLSLARAWLGQGDRDRAAQVLAPLVDAATAHGWPALVRLAATVLQQR